MDEQWFCTECGEQCHAIEVTFDYAATHCTYGRRGTHHTGIYVSDCCGADFSEDPPEETDADLS